MPLQIEIKEEDESGTTSPVFPKIGEVRAEESSLSKSIYVDDDDEDDEVLNQEESNYENLDIADDFENNYNNHICRQSAEKDMDNRAGEDSLMERQYAMANREWAGLEHRSIYKHELNNSKPTNLRQSLRDELEGANETIIRNNDIWQLNDQSKVDTEIENETMLEKEGELR